jgi:hypothetical protein
VRMLAGGQSAGLVSMQLLGTGCQRAFGAECHLIQCYATSSLVSSRCSNSIIGASLCPGLRLRRLQKQQQEERAAANAEAQRQAQQRIATALEANKALMQKKRGDFEQRQRLSEERRM